MENLVKQVNNVFNHFAQQELGNRLSDFAFGALKEITLKMIKDYKVEIKKEIKKERKEEVKKFTC